MTTPKEPKQALLCFHGTGSKGSIFNVQMARIYSQLSDTFEFIFVDGPRECPAGPGVLPMFDNQGPYYGWFGGYDSSILESLQQIDNAVQRGVQKWKHSHPEVAVDIVGGLGFSEGGLALALLLWLQQEQRQRHAIEDDHFSSIPLLKFAAISCCFFPKEASLWLNSRAKAHGDEKAMIDVPTLHIHGNRDFCLGRARQLVRNHYRPQFSTVLSVDTSHHMASQKDDVAAIVKHIRRLGGLDMAQSA